MVRGPSVIYSMPSKSKMPAHIQQLWALVDRKSTWPEGSDRHWRDWAACAGMGPTKGNEHAADPFYPGQGQKNLDAREICWSCPVELQCLLWAILSKESMGILGGMVPDERKELAEVAGISVIELPKPVVMSREEVEKLGERAQEALYELKMAMGGRIGGIGTKRRKRGRGRE